MQRQRDQAVVVVCGSYVVIGNILAFISTANHWFDLFPLFPLDNILKKFFIIKAQFHIFFHKINENKNKLKHK